MSLPALTTATPTCDLLLARGRELHVEGRPEASVAHLHHARLGVGGARPGLFGLAAVALLGSSHFGQLLQRRSDALLTFLGSTQLGRLRLALGLTRIDLRGLLGPLHQFACLTQVLLQAGLPTATMPPRHRRVRACRLALRAPG